MRKKNIDILEHIRANCGDIEAAVERFGKDKTVFDVDRDYRNSVCMSLLKIIYWPAIKGMRNLFAHNYGALDIDRVWETVISDIP